MKDEQLEIIETEKNNFAIMMTPKIKQFLEEFFDWQHCPTENDRENATALISEALQINHDFAYALIRLLNNITYEVPFLKDLQKERILIDSWALNQDYISWLSFYTRDLLRAQKSLRLVDQNKKEWIVPAPTENEYELFPIEIQKKLWRKDYDRVFKELKINIEIEWNKERKNQPAWLRYYYFDELTKENQETIIYNQIIHNLERKEKLKKELQNYMRFLPNPAALLTSENRIERDLTKEILTNENLCNISTN